MWTENTCAPPRRGQDQVEIGAAVEGVTDSMACETSGTRPERDARHDGEHRPVGIELP
jgi:hypothetical protein